jgi:hypothetical protein
MRFAATRDRILRRAWGKAVRVMRHAFDLPTCNLPIAPEKKKDKDNGTGKKGPARRPPGP